MNVRLDFIWTLPVQLRGTRNKWTLQKILSTVGFEPPTSQGLQISSPPLSPLGHHSLDMRLNKCPWNLLSINKLKKVHVYIASTMCPFQPYNVWILLKTVIKFAKQYRFYITIIGLCNAAMGWCMWNTSTKCQLPGISFITYEYC